MEILGKTTKYCYNKHINTITFSTFVVSEARNGKLYRCKITDANGNVVYSKAGEIVAKTLVIDSHPQNFYGAMGEQISFTVEARGEGLTYQWQESANGGTTWEASMSLSSG